MSTRYAEVAATSEDRKQIIPALATAAAGVVYQQDATALLVQNPATGLSIGAGLQFARVRATIAQLNAGAVTILPAVPGLRYRVVDWTLTSIGGAAGGATAVTIDGTLIATPTALATVLVAALTQNTAVKPNSANVTPAAGGAWNSRMDAGTAITATKTGGALTTATDVDFNICFELSE